VLAHFFLSIISKLDRKEKLNWVYLTTFQKVYTTDWTNSLVVEIYNVNIFIFKNCILF